MFIGKVLGKVILLPIMLLIFLVHILYRIGLEISSILAGGLILLVLGFLINALLKQTWEQAFLLFLTGGVLILFTTGAGLLDLALDTALEKLRDFMMS